ncbi:hypothetical protein C8J55DRAFT_493929 [Lentinula edodes]|uniref:Uncharacterized protein n=1 Tax=Lentinula lateritia TaxID=40482 RepID=A0A9W8ZRE0_9AGAR|nr:hypothetical protein C8J55DRAFT_493929 [Lentinula edodes]
MLSVITFKYYQLSRSSAFNTRPCQYNYNLHPLEANWYEQEWASNHFPHSTLKSKSKVEVEVELDFKVEVEVEVEVKVKVKVELDFKVKGKVEVEDFDFYLFQ